MDMLIVTGKILYPHYRCLSIRHTGSISGNERITACLCIDEKNEADYNKTNY
jgi:hypothetical protein